jgi:hypothetical protein
MAYVKKSAGCLGGRGPGTPDPYTGRTPGTKKPPGETGGGT